MVPGARLTFGRDACVPGGEEPQRGACWTELLGFLAADSDDRALAGLALLARDQHARMLHHAAPQRLLDPLMAALRRGVGRPGQEQALPRILAPLLHISSEPLLAASPCFRRLVPLALEARAANATSADVAQAVFGVLAHVSQHPVHSGAFVAVARVALCQALPDVGRSPRAAQPIWATLQNICAIGDEAAKVLREHADVPMVLEQLEQHRGTPRVLQHMLQAMLSMRASFPTGGPALLQAGGLLVDILEANMDDPLITERACVLLRTASLGTAGAAACLAPGAHPEPHRCVVACPSTDVFLTTLPLRPRHPHFTLANIAHKHTHARTTRTRCFFSGQIRRAAGCSTIGPWP